MPKDPVPTDSRSCTVHFRLSERPIAFQSSQFDVPLQQCIYQGPYSDVYCARLNAFDPPELVAVKGIRSMNEKDPNQFVQNELRIWRLLNDHPHIVHFLGVASLDQWPGLYTPPLAVCRYYHEGSPRQFIRKRNPTCVLRLELLTGIIRGLDHIHQQSVVHGDLKGANILVSGDGTPMLADFGNASLGESTISFTGTLGNNFSLRWTAPEMLGESGSPTRAADVYALGMTILETITGQVPFSNLRDVNTLIAAVHKRKTPKRPEDEIPSQSICGNILWALLMSCWAYNPELRPSAAQVRDHMKLYKPEMLTPIEAEPDSEDDSD